jgi:hypothetical protein
MRIFLEIKGLVRQTPPVPRGAEAVKFPQFPGDDETPGAPIVPCLPKKMLKIAIN